MSTENNKEIDSVDLESIQDLPEVSKPDEGDAVPFAKPEEKGESAILKSVLEQNEQLQKQIAEMNQRMEDISKRKGPEDDIDFDPDDLKRKPPEGCYLRCYKGSPIVKTKMKYKEEADKFGNVHQIGASIKLETLSGEVAEIPYGSTYSDDYLNLEKKHFSFTDSVEDTGASRVDRGVVIEKGQIVVKRNPNEQVYVDGNLQGGKGRVQQVVRKDIRYYTILVDGEKHEVCEDVLSK
jgi:hypothetical protein